MSEKSRDEGFPGALGSGIEVAFVRGGHDDEHGRGAEFLDLRDHGFESLLTHGITGTATLFLHAAFGEFFVVIGEDGAGHDLRHPAGNPSGEIVPQRVTGR